MTSSDGGADEPARATAGRFGRAAGPRRGASTARGGTHVERRVVPHLGSGDVRRDRLGTGHLAAYHFLSPDRDPRGDVRVAVPGLVQVRYAAVTSAGRTGVKRAVPGDNPSTDGLTASQTGSLHTIKETL